MDELNSPKTKISAKVFARLSWQAREALLPLDLPRQPLKPASRSGKLRQRHHNKRQTWRVAVGMVKLQNALHSGTLATQNSNPGYALSDRCRKAKQLALSASLSKAGAFARDHRNFRSTGGHHRPLQSMVKNLVQDSAGYFTSRAK